VITAILDRSPEPGLTAVLPRPGTIYQPSLKADSPAARPHIYDVPHLPLTPTWQEANFTLAALLPAWRGMPSAGIDLVDWTVALLGRYRYTLGATPSHFTSLRGTSSLLQLDRYLNGHPDVALLALNDECVPHIGRPPAERPLLMLLSAAAFRPATRSTSGPRLSTS
jgi:3-O-alpha-D-mannopyranosyl-alpha-D-mannopyranose xylosylphosphotransferase